MCKKGKLFVISAPSGAGKTTLCEQLIKKAPNMVRSISMTTRRIRKGEADGRDYFFTSEANFKKKIKKNDFLEFAKVFGNYYGTPRKFVEKNLDQHKNVLLNIDVQGAMKIRKKFRKDSVFIFIRPPSMQELKKRLFLRKTDTKMQIEKRLEIAKKELGYLKYYDYTVVNDDIKVAFRKLLSIVNKVGCSK